MMKERESFGLAMLVGSLQEREMLILLEHWEMLVEHEFRQCHRYEMLHSVREILTLEFLRPIELPEQGLQGRLVFRDC